MRDLLRVNELVQSVCPWKSFQADPTSNTPSPGDRSILHSHAERPDGVYTFVKCYVDQGLDEQGFTVTLHRALLLKIYFTSDEALASNDSSLVRAVPISEFDTVFQFCPDFHLAKKWFSGDFRNLDQG